MTKWSPLNTSVLDKPFGPAPMSPNDSFTAKELAAPGKDDVTTGLAQSSTFIGGEIWIPSTEPTRPHWHFGTISNTLGFGGSGTLNAFFQTFFSAADSINQMADVAVQEGSQVAQQNLFDIDIFGYNPTTLQSLKGPSGILQSAGISLRSGLNGQPINSTSTPNMLFILQHGNGVGTQFQVDMNFAFDPTRTDGTPLLEFDITPDTGTILSLWLKTTVKTFKGTIRAATTSDIFLQNVGLRTGTNDDDYASRDGFSKMSRDSTSYSFTAQTVGPAVGLTYFNAFTSGNPTVVPGVDGNNAANTGNWSCWVYNVGQTGCTLRAADVSETARTTTILVNTWATR